MKKRQYRHRQIQTSGGWLATGEAYILQDGRLAARVKLLRDRSADDALKFRLEVLQSNEGGPEPGSRLTITADWEGTGSWRLMDVDSQETQG